MSLAVHWFRRDLRLEDNAALSYAIRSKRPLLFLFIFDDNIISELPVDDPRISFIYNKLSEINTELNKFGSSLIIRRGKPFEVWKKIIEEHKIDQVFFNKDYEPYATDRDANIERLLNQNKIELFKYKDHVIFEENEILKNDNNPYSVFSPYKKKWLKSFNNNLIKSFRTDFSKNIYPVKNAFPKLSELGFNKSLIKVVNYNLNNIHDYKSNKNDLSIDSTTCLGPHLRFGTVSIRKVIGSIEKNNDEFLNELIWREFFIQILYHFPHVISRNFRAKYDKLKWRNNKNEFRKWCNGETGYPLVDAGMRQLNASGYMNNRLRMVTASFLCKHLLIDWRWGESYFAQKLLDFELSSNNGNWQWIAGTGCDAAPYFRIFNPKTQLEKYDPDYKYIKKWIPEFGTEKYSRPIIEHSIARKRAIEAYKKCFLELM